MPVQLGNLNNQWFNQKQVDTSGDGVISRSEMAQYTNQASQKDPSQQSWEEALGGQMIRSSDNNGGQSFFDIISKLDGQEGLSKKDLEMLAQKDGKGQEIAGADFKGLSQAQPAIQNNSAPAKEKQNPLSGLMGLLKPVIEIAKPIMDIFSKL